MSTGFYLIPLKVMDAVVANQNRTSLVTNKNRISMVSYTVKWTNGVTGSFSVEVCNDYVPSQSPYETPPNPGTWVPLLLNPLPIAPSGTAGSDHIELVLLSAAWIRLVFTDGSSGAGTGTITATIAGSVT